MKLSLKNWLKKGSSPVLEKDEEASALTPDEAQRKFFYLHILKTTDTSIRETLSEGFKQYQIFPNREVLSCGSGYPSPDEFWALTPKEKKKARFFMGQYAFGMRKAMGNNVDVLVFLRDPVERTISHLYHLKKNSAKFRERSIEEIFNQATKPVTNLQSRLVASEYIAPPPAPREITSATRANALEVGKQNLSNCRFVGITERISESIELLNRTYGFNIKTIPQPNFEHEQHDISNDVSSQLRQRIYKANARDYGLYRYGVQLFEQRLKEHL